MIARLLLVFLSATPALATAKTAELLLGTRYTSFHYKEILTAPAKSTETVTYPSLLIQGRVFAMPHTYLQLSYEDAKNVKSQYDGADLNTGAPALATNPLSFNTIDGTFFLGVTDTFSIYAGYGMRKWDRFLSGTPGYREIYSWNYLSLGLQYWFNINPDFEIGLDGCVRSTSGGKIKVITSETYGGEDSTMDLGARSGYRFSFPFIWRHDMLSFTAAPFYEFSRIGESNVVANATLAPTPGTGILEPSSETVQYGAELTIGYAF